MNEIPKGKVMETRRQKPEYVRREGLQRGGKKAVVNIKGVSREIEAELLYICSLWMLKEENTRGEGDTHLVRA
jgi:hypothetical protein